MGCFRKPISKGRGLAANLGSIWETNMGRWRITPTNKTNMGFQWYGCFLKWWYTPKHPKMIIFSRKTHGCWVPPFKETPIYWLRLVFFQWDMLPMIWEYFEDTILFSKLNLAPENRPGPKGIVLFQPFISGGYVSFRQGLGIQAKWIKWHQIPPINDHLGPGLRLAVPQSAMAACYPPRAAYKMHLDSYFLQGARGGREEGGGREVDRAGGDVPRLKRCWWKFQIWKIESGLI